MKEEIKTIENKQNDEMIQSNNQIEMKEDVFEKTLVSNIKVLKNVSEDIIANIFKKF